jgi:putative transposase
MRKTFQYRLYPTDTQRARLESIRETCRHFYNDLLAERKEAWEERKEAITKTAQLREVKVRKATNPYAKDVHSHILQVVASDLDLAFAAFFRRVKAGDKPGYPRFKSRDRFRGFGLKELGNGFLLDGRRVLLSGVGRIAVRWHRPLDGTIKTVRIVERAGKWYACFSCETVAAPLPATGHAVGIDVGLVNLFTTSDGDKEPNPRWYRKEQRALRVTQRRVARRKKGGKNRRKAVRRLQRQHEHIGNRRKDYLCKVACRLIQRYDFIALEDLAITRMVHGNLAKSILDAGWGFLVAHLMFKAASAGRVVALVNPAYTSQDCSGCGRRFDHLTLSDRWVTCACGLSLDRDHNAAINILSRARPGHGLRAVTLPLGGVVREAAGFYP